MRIRFIFFETKSPAWVDNARNEYVGKLAVFIPLELVRLKSPAADRDDALVKRRKEADMLMRQLDPKDLLILFDEGGREFSASEDFAKHLERHLESGKARMVFCIGGAYGFDQEVKTRSQARWSLSNLTMNHWIAQIMALEQLYRAMTIIKGIPYHNR